MTAILDLLSRLFALLPLRVALAVGRGCGRLAHVCSARRGEIRARIRESLGVSEAEARGIQRRVYANMGMNLVETLRLRFADVEELRSRIRFEGLERMPPAGQGCIALLAHTGNWEMQLVASCLHLPQRLNVVVKALKPESLNRWITGVRSRLGARIHDRRGSVRELIRVLRDGENLAFMLDQNAKRNWGIFVDFFGKPACTSDGLAQLAALTGAPILPVLCRRLEDHSLLVEVGEAIPGPTNRGEPEIHRVTAACTRVIEDFIRAHPDQWIWMHRRWRTQPSPAKPPESTLDDPPDAD